VIFCDENLALGLFCLGNDVITFLRGHGNWFFNDDMFSVGKRSQSQSMVRIIGSADDHRIDVLMRDGLVVGPQRQIT